MYRVVLSF